MSGQGDIRCPACRVVSTHPVPEDSCLFFLDCPVCGVLVRPLPGDCCVFCSYGSTPCPPVRQARAACCTPQTARGSP